MDGGVDAGGWQDGTAQPAAESHGPGGRHSAWDLWRFGRQRDQGCAQVALRSQEAWADHFRATSARSRRPPVKAPPIHPWVMLIDG